MEKCTRFFTQEQIDEIRRRLTQLSGVKDSQFEKAVTFNKNDQVAIVQQGKNKKIDIGELRNWLFALDDIPTQGSENPVTSDGIYTYIQNILSSIISEGKYLYIQGDSDMFNCLVYGPGDIYTQEQYDEYCNTVYEAINNDYFIIIDTSICVAGSTVDPQYFSLSYISPAENVLITAQKSNGIWVKGSTSVDLGKFLIDNTYLDENQYINLSTVNSILANYLTKAELTRLTENYPHQGSTKLVTSNGIWQAIQNATANIFTEDEILIITDDMMELLITGESSPQIDDCCNTIFNACENKMLIVYKDGICRYDSQETDSSKTFSLSVITTTNQHLMSAFIDNTVQEAQWVIRQHSQRDNHILQSPELTNTLQSYYTKAQIDALLATINGYIRSNRTLIDDHYNEYLTRMESTPKYHKANWLLDEIDQQGRVTAETSVATPADRFNSMWWAVKQSKMITFYGIPDVYRESQIEGTTPDNANSIIVKFLISEVITTYKIEKKYIENIQTNENLYLQVTRTDDQIDRVNSIMTKGIDIIDNPTMVGSNVNKYTVDLSNNLDQFNSFSDVGNISNVPLIIDPNLNITPLMGDLKIIKCGGLLTNKTDYINLPNILGNPSLTLYGSLLDGNTYISGNINLSMNEDDNLVITYVETSGSTHSLVINDNISNDQIAAFLNSIIKNFNVIKDTKALSLLLSIFQCTVQFGGVVQDANFFIRTNNTYQLHTNNNVPLLEIAEL